MKKACILVFILSICTNVFLEEKINSELVGLEYAEGPVTKLIFKSANSVIVFDEVSEKIVHDYCYEIIYRDKIVYIRIQYDDMQMKEYLVLYNKYIMIWYEDGRLEPKYIFGKYNSILDNVGPIYSSKIEVSSSLVEKTKVHSASNLGDLNLESVWAEGSSDLGVGEYIKITNISLDAIIIFSGYVSYVEPWLYSQNARPKSISVICEKTGYNKKFDLLDTPNPQVLDLGVFIKNQDITIVIEDIYRGTQYSDLCISGLWFRIMTNKEIWQ